VKLLDPTLLHTRARLGDGWSGGDSGATYPVLDPANGEDAARVPRLGIVESP
jgi:succinate-semialdehyde dehydrogenase/glutarate-semialdehyde dehydrogenase